jgi:hypothetical protein
MILSAKDIGTLVDHTVWQRGKVVDVAAPYAFVHFPSLEDSEQGPLRKVQSTIEHLTRSSVQSDPAFDSIPSALSPAKAKSKAGGAKRKSAKSAKTAKAATADA